MALIEQAVFARTVLGHANRYELIGQSPGISSIDAAALVAWGPAHDCLLDSRPSAASTSFFPLPSGAFCISQSRPSRDGLHPDDTEVMTRCYVVGASDMAQVHNDPFAMLRLLPGPGNSQAGDVIGGKLGTILVDLQTPEFDALRLSQAVATHGMPWIVGAIDMLLNHSAVAIVGDTSRELLVAAVVMCLPPSCRLEVSFSTGLKYSPRRPFRLFAVGIDPAEQRRANRQGDVVMLDLRDNPPALTDSQAGWSAWVQATIGNGQPAKFVERLKELPSGLRLSRLDAWGNLFLDGTSIRDTEVLPVAPPASSNSAKPSPSGGSRVFHQATAPSAAVVEEATHDPAMILGQHCPAALEVLETLDDTVFETLCGRAGALDELKSLWPDVLRRLGPDLVEEARAEYVRHVMNLWRHCVEGDEIRNPTMSVTAVEVIDFLLSGR